MLENLRKRFLFMAIVVVILFVALVFLGVGDNGMGNLLGGPSIASTDDKTYKEQDILKLGQNGIRLAQELGPDGYYYLASLGGAAQNENTQLINFSIKRHQFQMLMKQLGLNPSKERIEQYLQTDSIFVSNGEFSQETYDRYIQQRLPNLGMNVKDFNAFIGELISFKKIRTILSSGIQVNPKTSEQLFTSMRQEVTYRLFSVSRASQEASIQPSEEDIKTHWELHKSSYKTPAKAKITYLLSAPDLPQPPTPPTSSTETQEVTPDEQARYEEARQAYESTHKQSLLEAMQAMDLLWANLQDLDGNDFEEAAKQAGYQTVQTDLFSLDQLPKALQHPIKNARGMGLAEAIQKVLPGTGTMDSISDVYQLENGQFLLFRVDEFMKPALKTFEQAKNEARLDTINAQASLAMEKEAKQRHEELSKLLKNGSSISEAIKTLNLEAPLIGPTHLFDSIEGVEDPRTLFILASKTNPGELSEVRTQNQAGLHRSCFVYVQSRTIHNSKQNQVAQEHQYEQLNKELPDYIFQNWIQERYNASNPKLPKTQNH